MYSLHTTLVRVYYSEIWLARFESGLCMPIWPVLTDMQTINHKILFDVLIGLRVIVVAWCISTTLRCVSHRSRIRILKQVPSKDASKPGTSVSGPTGQNSSSYYTWTMKEISAATTGSFILTK